MLASYAFRGQIIGDFLNQLADRGFFSYLLPFLLIFAIVYGILTKIRIFKDSKAINAIIAFVVGLMALQFDFVHSFFSEIFPRFGVTLAILLIILILVGLFLNPESKAIDYVLMCVGALMLIIILIQTAGVLGWETGYWWYDNWPYVAGIVFVLVMIAVIVGVSNPSTEKSKSPLSRALRGED